MKRALLAAVAAGLSACAQDRYSPTVSTGDIRAVAQEPVEAAPMNIAGVDIWDSGIPRARYKVLGVIHDTRRNVGYDQQAFYKDIAMITRARGGDGAIIILSDSKTIVATEDCVSGMLTASECADKSSGASYSPYEPEGERTIYSENRDSNEAPLEYRKAHVLVIKYSAR